MLEYLIKFDEEIMVSACNNLSTGRFKYLCMRILEIMENDYNVNLSELIEAKK